jgi:NADH-quinone oxidoreductase subunit A
MLDDYYRQYGLVLILSLVAVIIPVSIILVSWLAQFIRIRPHKPSLTKSDVYECGMETMGGRWVQFNFRYYLYALLFLIFDVLAIFIYPWAVQLKSLGFPAYLQMLAFVLLLSLGWVYAWRKGAMEWR